MAEDDFLDSNLEVTVATDRDSLLRRARATGEAILIVLNGSEVGHRAVLGEGAFVIGRGAAAGLQLEGDAISRVHARVVRDTGEYYLVDAGSTNGSFVNYSKVGRQRLTDGDEIQIGHVLLKFLSGDNIETAYHEEFRRLVRHDALTGALNRATFDLELKAALRRSEGTVDELSLVLFDLDHFKQVNDTWGHTAGDLVLRAVGDLCTRLAGDAHLFARVGGEEFGVIFAGPLAEAVRFGDRLRLAIAELRIDYDGETIQVKTSVGVASLREGTGPSQLFQVADRLLYQAKERGRNRLCHPGDDVGSDDEADSNHERATPVSPRSARVKESDHSEDAPAAPSNNQEAD